MHQGFNNFFPNNENNKERIIPILKWAEEHLSDPICSLPYSSFCTYYENGNRNEYEGMYMKHRERFFHYFAAAMWEDDKRWIKALSDVLLAICEDSFWAFPAHIPKECSYKEAREWIDLFSAETAAYLSECSYLLGERLPEYVRDAIKTNVIERVIKPYINGPTVLYGNNWSSVCHGCIAIAMLSLGLFDEFSSSIEKIKDGLEDFLDSYPDDGVCLEGALYWTYGFSNFTYAASMIREYTNGKVDFFDRIKTKKCAEYYRFAFVDNPNTVPFSDASHILYLNPGLISFLSKEYGFPTISKKAVMPYGFDLRFRIFDMIRNFFWGIEYTEEKAESVDLYFDKSQQLYVKNPLYTLVVKGGHNDEPHNHNDIGSFVVYTKDGYICDDLGWPEYTEKYFNPDFRYKDFIVASSLGHSVPIINGKEQLCGKDAKAVLLSRSDGEILFDISQAYGFDEGNVTRKISYGVDNISVCDKALCGGLVSRFVTRIKPCCENGKIFIADSVIEANSACEIKIADFDFETHWSVNKAEKERFIKAYIIDFIPERNDELTINVKVGK